MAETREGPAASEGATMDEISPTSTPRPSIIPEEVEEGLSRPASQDADAKRVEQQEAMQYWGYLVKRDKCGSDKLNCLLEGIANYIVSVVGHA